MLDRREELALLPLEEEEAERLLASVPIETWNVRAQSPTMRHVGPVAQDFNGRFAYLFGEVESPVYINNMDAVGISLAASQGLYQLMQEKNEQIAELAVRLSQVEGSQRIQSSVGWTILSPAWGIALIAFGWHIGRHGRRRSQTRISRPGVDNSPHAS